MKKLIKIALSILRNSRRVQYLGVVEDLDPKEFPNFRNDEVGCRHCGLIYIDKFSMVRLQLARTLLGRPIPLTSACRCLNYNRFIKSRDDSYHIAIPEEDRSSRAFDVPFLDGLDLLDKLIIFYVVGFRRLGINFNKNFIHIDTGERHLNGRDGLIFPY